MPIKLMSTTPITKDKLKLKSKPGKLVEDLREDLREVKNR